MRNKIFQIIIIITIAVLTIVLSISVQSIVASIDPLIDPLKNWKNPTQSQYAKFDPPVLNYSSDPDVVEISDRSLGVSNMVIIGETLKIGSFTTGQIPCDINREGTLLYNKDLEAVQFCNQGEWEQLSR